MQYQNVEYRIVMDLKPLEESSILVVGVVRNCAGFLKHNIVTIKNSLQKAHQIRWFLVESDSEDDTLKQLDLIKNLINEFDFVSLGELGKALIKRTERIAHCRNRYIQEIRNNANYSDIDFIVVADLDGVNNDINEESIKSCWEYDQWDVCTANQSAPYYDVWALRHKIWNPSDCWDLYRFLEKYSSDREQNKIAAIYSKMIRIPISNHWIEVDSAFGGLAIYKAKLFHEAEYCGIRNDGQEICEHVPLNLKLRSLGYRIFINPKLINSGFNHHTRKLKLIHRMRRNIKRLFNIQIRL